MDEKVNLNKNSSPEAEALLKRGYMLLEDGEWEKARKYFSRSLDLDPENAQAYLGRLMSHLKVKNKEDLKNAAEPFDHSKNYANIMRFADPELKYELIGYNEHIKERNLENQYNEAKRLMDSAQTEDEFNEAAEAFKSLGDYKNSAELEKQCGIDAENAKTEHLKESKKRNKIIIKFAGIGTATVVFVVLLVNVIIPQVKYNNAVSLMDGGKYDEAEAEFKELGDLNDSKEKITETEQGINAKKYDDAMALLNAGNYEEAAAKFEELGDFSDSQEKIKEARYNYAVSLMDKGDYEDAVKQFSDLSEYNDSAEQIENINLIFLKEQISEGKFAAGDTLYFGSYEQDGSKSNGKEPILWRVLEADGTKLLLVSDEILDIRSYNNAAGEVKWADCSLRTWLNNEFLKEAFSDSEQNYILNTILNDDNQYIIDRGWHLNDEFSNWQEFLNDFLKNDAVSSNMPVEDKLFILSFQQLATEYPVLDYEVKYTTYAKSKEKSAYPYYELFWASTPVLSDGKYGTSGTARAYYDLDKKSNKYVLNWDEEGYVAYTAYPAGSMKKSGVRPVMWIGEK